MPVETRQQRLWKEVGKATLTQGQPYFSRSTGGRDIMEILRQYHTMATKMLGVRKVFMANHTLVKPPFWWIPWTDTSRILRVDTSLYYYYYCFCC